MMLYAWIWIAVVWLAAIADVTSATGVKWTVLAEVAGDMLANDAYWLDKCAGIPGDAIAVKVVMGEVVDYFCQTDSRGDDVRDAYVER